jgi:hypothetical protein
VAIVTLTNNGALCKHQHGSAKPSRERDKLEKKTGKRRLPQLFGCRGESILFVDGDSWSNSNAQRLAVLSVWPALKRSK